MELYSTWPSVSSFLPTCFSRVPPWVAWVLVLIPDRSAAFSVTDHCSCVLLISGAPCLHSSLTLAASCQSWLSSLLSALFSRWAGAQTPSLLYIHAPGAVIQSQGIVHPTCVHTYTMYDSDLVSLAGTFLWIPELNLHLFLDVSYFVAKTCPKLSFWATHTLLLSSLFPPTKFPSTFLDQ